MLAVLFGPGQVLRAGDQTHQILVIHPEDGVLVGICGGQIQSDLEVEGLTNLGRSVVDQLLADVQVANLDLGVGHGIGEQHAIDIGNTALSHGAFLSLVVANLRGDLELLALAVGQDLFHRVGGTLGDFVEGNSLVGVNGEGSDILAVLHGPVQILRAGDQTHQILIGDPGSCVGVDIGGGHIEGNLEIEGFTNLSRAVVEQLLADIQAAKLDITADNRVGDHDVIAATHSTGSGTAVLDGSAAHLGGDVEPLTVLVRHHFFDGIGCAVDQTSDGQGLIGINGEDCNVLAVLGGPVQLLIGADQAEQVIIRDPGGIAVVSIGSGEVHRDLELVALSNLSRRGVDHLLADVQLAHSHIKADNTVGEQHSIQIADAALSQGTVLRCCVANLGSDIEPCKFRFGQDFFHSVGGTVSNAIDGDGLPSIHSEGSTVLAVLLGPGQILRAGNQAQQVLVIHPEDGILVGICSGQIQSDLEVEGFFNFNRAGIDQVLADVQVAQLHIGINHGIGEQDRIALSNRAIGGAAVLFCAAVDLAGNSELLTVLRAQGLFHLIGGTVSQALDGNSLVSVHGEGGSVLAVLLGPFQLLGAADLAHQILVVHPGSAVLVGICSGQIQSDLEVEGLANLSGGVVDQLLADTQIAQSQFVTGDNRVGEQHCVLICNAAGGDIAALGILSIHLGGNGEPLTVLSGQNLFHGEGGALSNAVDGDGLVGIHGEGGTVLAVLLSPGQIFGAADQPHQIFIIDPEDRVLINICSGQIQGDLEVEGLANLGGGVVHQLLADTQIAKLHSGVGHGVGEQDGIHCGNTALGNSSILSSIVADLGGDGKLLTLLSGQDLFDGVSHAVGQTLDGDGFGSINGEGGRVLVILLGPVQLLGAADLTHQILVIHPEDGILVGICSGQIQSDLEVEGFFNFNRAGIDQVLADVQVAQLHIGINHGIGEQDRIALSNRAIGGAAVLFCAAVDLAGNSELLTVLRAQGLFHLIGGTVSQALDGNSLVSVHGEGGSVLAVLLGPFQLLGAADLAHQILVVHPGSAVLVGICSGQIQSDLEVEGLANLSGGVVDQLLADTQIAQSQFVTGDNRVGEQHCVLICNAAGGDIAALGILSIHLGGNGEPLTVLSGQNLFHGEGGALSNAVDGDGLVGIHGEGGTVLAVLLSPGQIFGAADQPHQIFIIDPEDRVLINICSGQIQGDLEVEGLANFGRSRVDQVLADVQVSELYIGGNNRVGEQNGILGSNGTLGNVAVVGSLAVHLGGDSELLPCLIAQNLFHGVGSTLSDTLDGDGFAGIHGEGSGMLAVGIDPAKLLRAADLTHQVSIINPGSTVLVGICSGQIQGDLKVEGLADLGGSIVDQLLADRQITGLDIGGDDRIGEQHGVLGTNGTICSIAVLGGLVIHLGSNGEPFLILSGQDLFYLIGGTQRHAVHTDGFTGFQREGGSQLVAGHGPGQSLGSLQLSLDVIGGHPGNAVAHQRSGGQVQGQLEVKGFIGLGRSVIDQLLADLQTAAVPGVGDTAGGNVAGDGLVAGQCLGFHKVILIRIGNGYLDLTVGIGDVAANLLIAAVLLHIQVEGNAAQRLTGLAVNLGDLQVLGTLQRIDRH